jgi:hypothetical protein
MSDFFSPREYRELLADWSTGLQFILDLHTAAGLPTDQRLASPQLLCSTIHAQAIAAKKLTEVQRQQAYTTIRQNNP